jgi:hypothetical protein
MARVTLDVPPIDLAVCSVRCLAYGVDSRISVPRGNYAMHKRLVTRYATQSAIAADENERRIEAVFC